MDRGVADRRERFEAAYRELYEPICGYRPARGPGDGRERFEAAYRELYEPICGYVLRRVRGPEDAAEAIAETFATLWRRFDRCPQGEELKPWLFGVARRVIANQRRGERRRTALGERV